MSWDSVVSTKLQQLRYPNKTQAKADILAALAQFSDLHPEVKKYTYNDGKVLDTLTLTGTVPVHFQGTKYNIPVCIYLMQSHPFVPPLVYVIPTSTMVIKPGKHVDQKGRVYMPYLTQWKHPQYDLTTLVNMMSMIFGESPPVYSKQAAAAQQQQQQQQQAYGGGYHPQPAGYPTAGAGGMPMPGGYPRGSSQYPPPPGNAAGFPPQGGYQAAQPYPTAGPSYPATAGYAAQPPAYTSTPASTYAGPVVTETMADKAALTRQQSSIDDDMIRRSLLTAVEDKLKRRVLEVFTMGKQEIENLEKTKQNLEQGSATLNDMMTRIKTEKGDIETNISLLQQKNSDIEEAIKQMEDDSQNLNIDDAVQATTPLYNQILDLYAEENAIQDVIYCLNDALRRDVITIDVFLKNVRKLSTRQFMVCATLRKARKTAGLR